MLALLLPGQLLDGRYRIEEPIGAGGMGRVYRAHDVRLDRTVAIKTLLPELCTDPLSLQRFAAEARLGTRVAHPSLVAVHDVEISADPGQPSYVVMEHLVGRTLHDRLSEGPLPLHEALRRAADLCDVVAALHSAKIIHRDIKPANVMLVGRGSKLLDLGVAHLAGETVARMTATGAYVGTVLYLPPEVLRGERAGPAGDVWALGLVLFAMLSGQRPYRGEIAEHVQQVMSAEKVPDVRRFSGEVPAAVARLVEMLLHKDPKRRPAARVAAHVARELADELAAPRARKTLTPETLPDGTRASITAVTPAPVTLPKTAAPAVTTPAVKAARPRPAATELLERPARRRTNWLAIAMVALVALGLVTGIALVAVLWTVPIGLPVPGWGSPAPTAAAEPPRPEVEDAPPSRDPLPVVEVSSEPTRPPARPDSPAMKAASAAPQ